MSDIQRKLLSVGNGYDECSVDGLAPNEPHHADSETRMLCVWKRQQKSIG